jgi:thymidylate synthase (FAD)
MKTSKSSVHLVDSMGSDLSVVNAARVSFAKESDWDYDIKHDGRCNERLTEKDQKLINYLAKHQHWSPFAHNSLTFRIKAPIFVARQLVKHQVGGVWNEVSRRYVDDEPEFYFPEVWRGKPENAKQGSTGVFDTKFFVDGNKEVMSVHATNLCYTAVQLYNQAVHNGMAPEQARMILPQNTMTEWWWTGSLMFFARVCKQRLDPHAQQETREIAEQLAASIPTEFQHSWKALMT